MSDQLQMFQESPIESNDSGQMSLTVDSLSLSEALVKILAWLENEKGWTENGVVLSHEHLRSYLSSDQTFLSGRMLKGHSAQTLAQTFGRLSKPLPTYGMIDSNGNCLIQHGFYPKIESGYTLSDILEKEVDETYFLSEKMIKSLVNHTEKMNAKGNGFKFNPHEMPPV